MRRYRTTHALLIERNDLTYFVHDTYSTDVAAGSVNGTAAEPGPGTRIVTDPSNHISISGGAAVFSGSTATAGEVIGYDPGADKRAAGVGFFVTMGNLPNGVHLHRFGSAAQPSGTRDHMYTASSGAVTASRGAGSDVAVTSGGYVSGAHTIAILLRAAGKQCFVKTGGTWRLLYVDATGTGARQHAESYGSSTDAQIADFAVLPTGFLAIPVASDGFGSAFGNADGLGHAEGSAGGIGAGGGSATWTSNVGTWATSSGTAAASALSSGIAYATVTPSQADQYTSVAVTRSAGNAGLVIRYTDSDNYARLYHDGTNVELVEVIAGTPQAATFSSAATYSAGALLTARTEGAALRAYYNGLAAGTATLNAALTGAGVGLYTTDTSNTFDSFTSYNATGYAELDGFSA